MTENKKTGREDISDRLHDAIDGLRKDVTRVEIWATALSTFAQPVPDYRPNPKYELGKPVETGALTKKGNRKPAGNDPEKPSN